MPSGALQTPGLATGAQTPTVHGELLSAKAGATQRSVVHRLSMEAISKISLVFPFHPLIEQGKRLNRSIQLIHTRA